jgi:hypothetical protein
VSEATGLPTIVDDQGDTSTSTDDKCTRTWYVQDPSGANLPVLGCVKTALAAVPWGKVCKAIKVVTTTDKDFTTPTLDTAPTRGPPSAKPGKSAKPEQQTLTTTWHHPFWDATRHRWTDAHDLKPGTELRRADGTTVVVRGVRDFHRHGTTYDLTVGTLHTYYVLAGDTPLLVHNCPTGGATGIPDFDPDGIPRHQPGTAAGRSG